MDSLTIRCGLRSIRLPYQVIETQLNHVLTNQPIRASFSFARPAVRFAGVIGCFRQKPLVEGVSSGFLCLLKRNSGH